MEAKGGRFAALRRPLRPWSHGTLMYLLALLDFRPECGIRSFLPGIVKVTAFRNHLSPKLPHMARLPELRKAKLLTTGTLDNAIDGAPRDDERSNLDGKYTNLIPPIIHTSSGTLSQETDLSPSGNISIPSAVDLLLAAETGYIIPTQIYEVLSDSATVSDSEILESEQTHSTIQEDRLDVVVPPNLQDVFEEGHKGIKSKPVDSPGVAKILRFAVPAIGVWLCGPILSLIDTSAVGLLSGTAHQAALSPAVAVSDYGALLMSFMYTATTNLVSGAQEIDKDDPKRTKTVKTLIASLQLSLYVGLALSLLLMASSRILLKGIIGNDAIDPVVFSTALKYIRIRALGLPAAAMIGSAQSACLGMQDIKSPLYVLLAAAVVNFLGDAVLVGCKNPWIGGAPGAAWATVLSQYAAMTMFVKWLSTRSGGKNSQCTPNETIKLDRHAKESRNVTQATPPKYINLSKAILRKTSWIGGNEKKSSGKTDKGLRLSKIASIQGKLHVTSKTARAQRALLSAASQLRGLTFAARLKGKKIPREQEVSFSTRGLLDGRLKMSQLVKPPKKEAALEFMPYVLPVTTTSLGRVSAYVTMSYVVSSCLGTVAMAAQQVIVSIFYCLCPVADALSLTAQSFVPALYERRKSKESATILDKTRRDFMKAGGIFGAFLMGAVACIPAVNRLFTTDPVVIAQVNAVVPLLAVSFSVHGIICASEGLMLGQKDLEFLGKAYAFYFAAVPWAMLRVKNAVVAGVPADLTSVWKVFAGYQIVRCAMFAGRSLLLSKRARREFSAAQSLIKVIDDVGVHKVGKSMTEVDGLVDRAHSFSEEIVAA